MSVVSCPACGHHNKPDARFCAYCGALLEAEPAMLQPGQFVDSGSYQILRPLGKGGMGAVYLAANTRAFDRPCVVKEVIEYYDPNDPEERRKAMERFESEARTLASLKHPGIPDIYSYFSEGGRNYLVMEYIEGPNLAQGLTREKDGQLVPGGSLPIEEVVRYAIQMCEVLIYLEQRQPPVMHNDIKPANIILDKNSGRAVLVDFGTAKTRYTRQAAGQPGRQQSSVYGTVGYAAPELYEGKAEPRSDVYALAATCYHLLTDDDPRDHPFKFPKMDTLPEPVRAILRDALQVRVEERSSAVELKERLLAFTTPEVQGAIPEIQVKPAQVDLGTVPDGEVFSEIRTFTVRNEGQRSLDCRIENVPPWLTIAPQTFLCPPGHTTEVTLRGQVYKLSKAGTRHSVALEVKAQGARASEVQVTLRTGSADNRGRRLGTALMIGSASLILLGAIIWFIVVVLPTLLP